MAIAEMIPEAVVGASTGASVRLGNGAWVAAVRVGTSVGEWSGVSTSRVGCTSSEMDSKRRLVNEFVCWCARHDVDVYARLGRGVRRRGLERPIGAWCTVGVGSVTAETRAGLAVGERVGAVGVDEDVGVASVGW